MMKTIVYSNVSCVNPSVELKLVIYYKTSNLKSAVSRNKTSPVLPKLQRSHLVYEYTCNYGECEHQKSSYVGMAATALSRRLTMHLLGGAPFEHSKRVHGTSLTRDVIMTNTEVIKTEPDQIRLPILEATLIQSMKTKINNQHTRIQRTLKLHSFHNLNRSANVRQYFTTPHCPVTDREPAQTEGLTTIQSKAQTSSRPVTQSNTLTSRSLFHLDLHL